VDAKAAVGAEPRTQRREQARAHLRQARVLHVQKAPPSLQQRQALMIWMMTFRFKVLTPLIGEL